MISILLTGADLSRTVGVPLGEPVCVTLEDISTTGYRWSAAAEGARASVTDAGVEAGGAPGASGRRRFEVVTAAKGRVVVRFELKRPWQPQAAPEREAVLTLDVE